MWTNGLGGDFFEIWKTEDDVLAKRFYMKVHICGFYFRLHDFYSQNRYSSIQYHKSILNLSFVLILSPNLIKATTNGKHANTSPANNVLPQPCPSAAYIFGPASGNNAPPRLRNTVFAAFALAAYSVNASTRYALTGRKLVITPAPIATCPRMGIIH